MDKELQIIRIIEPEAPWEKDGVTNEKAEGVTAVVRRNLEHLRSKELVRWLHEKKIPCSVVMLEGNQPIKAVFLIGYSDIEIQLSSTGENFSYFRFISKESRAHGRHDLLKIQHQIGPIHLRRRAIIEHPDLDVGIISISHPLRTAIGTGVVFLDQNIVLPPGTSDYDILNPTAAILVDFRPDLRKDIFNSVGNTAPPPFILVREVSNI